MALHPLRRMRCKVQVETPSDSLFWAELSGLLGEKIPVAIVGLEPGTPGSVVQRFNYLATKQPCLQKRSGTAGGLQVTLKNIKTALGEAYLGAHYCTQETRSCFTEPTHPACNSLESPTPSKQPHLLSQNVDSCHAFVQ